MATDLANGVCKDPVLLCMKYDCKPLFYSILHIGVNFFGIFTEFFGASSYVYLL